MSRSHIYTMSSSVSCGIMEVGSLLKDPARNAWEIANKLYHPARGQPEAFIMASDHAAYSPDETEDGEEVVSRSQRTLHYLKEKGFIDRLNTSPPALNPKSGSTIRVWLGRIDHEEFRKWYKQESINRLSRSL